MAPVLGKRPSREHAFEQAVAAAFRRAHWQVVSQPHVGESRADLLVQRGDRQYVVEVKSSPEARRDRVIPVLAQGILQVKAVAAQVSQAAAPLVVIGVPRLSESLFDDLQSFAAKVAPDVSIGIVDSEGSRLFAGPDLQELSRISLPASSSGALPSIPASSVHLFSDLNQWMMKVLLSPGLSSDLLEAPRERIAGAAELANVAGVSAMSAFRCLNSLKAHGFLDKQAGFLRLINVEGLLRQWRAARHKPIREMAMRWLIPGDPERQLQDAIRSYLDRYDSRAIPGRHHVERGLPYPRVCLGLFAAAEALGFGFVHGVAPHLYMERNDRRALESLGLIAAQSGQRADVFVRIPPFREAVFRGVVSREGIRVSDVLQVWLDVADHPARGASQAEEIWRRVLVQLVRTEPS